MIEFYFTPQFSEQTFEVKSTSYLPVKSSLAKYAIQGASVIYLPLSEKDELLIQSVLVGDNHYYLVAAALETPFRVFLSSYTATYLQSGLICGKASCTLWGLGEFEMRIQETRVTYLGAGEQHFVRLPGGEHLISMHSVSYKEIAWAAGELNVFGFMKFQGDTNSRFSVQQVLASGIPSAYFAWVLRADLADEKLQKQFSVQLRNSFKQFIDMRNNELILLKYDHDKVEIARKVRTLIINKKNWSLNQIFQACGVADYDALRVLLYQLIGQIPKAFQLETVLDQMFEMAESGEVKIIDACIALGRSRSAVARLFDDRFQISFSRLSKLR